MATLFDRVLAIIGWFAATVRGSPAVIATRDLDRALLFLDRVLILSSRLAPTDDPSLDDMRLTVPAVVGRPEGELHSTSSAFGGLYELHDTKDPP
jgi:hypothetical protein